MKQFETIKNSWNDINYRQKTALILKEYKRCKFQLENQKGVSQIIPDSLKHKTLIANQNYVKAVENAMGWLDENHCRVLTHFCKKKHHTNDLNYSPTWYYKTLDKACKEFYFFFSC
ncbi:MG284/MPN403 family protein [[Mycoplasma] testudinis]|uniref:MG284/MPN403 family protein n=1 Tax=[Mycoplasma] testudinis TaxID=33924 RepID=UPI000487D444|nr:hypothetical protein [[Mycoplasma] testudinis]